MVSKGNESVDYREPFKHGAPEGRFDIACNKVKKVRCAKVNNIKEAKWACKDNDANIIALSAKMPTFRAKDIVDVFLSTQFSGFERHKKRIEALDKYKG